MRKRAKGRGGEGGSEAHLHGSEVSDSDTSLSRFEEGLVDSGSVE